MVNVWQVFGTIPITDLMLNKNLLLSLALPLLVQPENPLLCYLLSSFPRFLSPWLTFTSEWRTGQSCATLMVKSPDNADSGVQILGAQVCIGQDKRNGFLWF